MSGLVCFTCNVQLYTPVMLETDFNLILVKQRSEIIKYNAAVKIELPLIGSRSCSKTLRSGLSFMPNSNANFGCFCSKQFTSKANIQC